MSSVIFVVWRESTEALLVIGILWSWVSRYSQPGVKRYIVLGALCGLLLASILGILLFRASDFMGTYGSIFVTSMVIVSSFLIVHMVVWLRQHAKTMRQELRDVVSEGMQRNNFWAIALLCATAVAREGSETVVFLYGILSTANNQLFILSVGGIIGLIASFLTFYSIQLGGKYISWSFFFRITEIMLLFLGASLFLKGFDSLFNYLSDTYDVIPYAMFDPLWDTSSLMSDSSAVGSVFYSLFAYRATPSLLILLTFAFYWLLVGFLIKKSA